MKKAACSLFILTLLMAAYIFYYPRTPAKVLVYTPATQPLVVEPVETTAPEEILVTDIVFDSDSIELVRDTKLLLSYQVTPDNAFHKALHFESGNPDILSVSEDGMLHGVAIGETTLHLSSTDGSHIHKEIHVAVKEKTVTLLSFTQTDYTISCMDTFAPEFRIEPSDIPTSSLLWQSDNPGIVAVSEDGLITGGAKGEAVITVSTPDRLISENLNITVSNGALPPLDAIPPSRFEEIDGVHTRLNKEKEDKATIMLAGDLMCLSAQQSAASRGGTYNFNGSYKYVRDIFAQSDFAAANLETMISHSRSTSLSLKTFESGSPNCNAPATYLDAVRFANIDAVATANNHTLDTGAQGLRETMFHLDRYNLIHTGAYENPDIPPYQLFNINGIKVGLLSYTLPLNQGISGDYSYMIKRYSKDALVSGIAALRENGAEFIIAYIHWGEENTHSVNGTQRSVAQEMADAGVDVIAGSHPHCLQEAKYVTAADGREVLCIYSMGNFVSSMTREINNDTVIVSFDIEKTDDSIRITDAGYYPCHVYVGYSGASHVIVPVSSAYNDNASLSGLASVRSRIENVMGPDLRVLE